MKLGHMTLELAVWVCFLFDQDLTTKVSEDFDSGAASVTAALQQLQQPNIVELYTASLKGRAHRISELKDLLLMYGDTPDPEDEAPSRKAKSELKALLASEPPSPPKPSAPSAPPPKPSAPSAPSM